MPFPIFHFPYPKESIATYLNSCFIAHIVTMAAAQDLSSPFHYSASQTALLLLDFQSFTIKLCGTAGEDALANAVRLRQWALSKGILVVHSIVDVNDAVPAQTKGSSRIQNMLAGIKDDQEAAKEPASIAAGSGEVVVLKQPGVVSGLKSDGCKEMLEERGIKNLIICGLSTSGAVLRTAVPATDDGFVVSVVRDACADRTVELHDTLMDSVLPSRAYVSMAKDVVDGWEKGK